MEFVSTESEKLIICLVYPTIRLNNEYGQWVLSFQQYSRKLRATSQRALGDVSPPGDLIRRLLLQGDDCIATDFQYCPRPLGPLVNVWQCLLFHWCRGLPNKVRVSSLEAG